MNSGHQKITTQQRVGSKERTAQTESFHFDEFSGSLGHVDKGILINSYFGFVNI